MSAGLASRVNVAAIARPNAMIAQTHTAQDARSTSCQPANAAATRTTKSMPVRMTTSSRVIRRVVVSVPGGPSYISWSCAALGGGSWNVASWVWLNSRLSTGLRLSMGLLPWLVLPG